MFKKDNKLYAGITCNKGVELFNSLPSYKQHTGFVFKRLFDGLEMGPVVDLTNPYIDDIENLSKYYIEVEKEEPNPTEMFQVDNVIYAGIINQEGLDILNSKEDKDTGFTFYRIHDGLEIGNVINLGYDFSYSGKRLDKPYYYVVKFKEETNEEQIPNVD